MAESWGPAMLGGDRNPLRECKALLNSPGWSLGSNCPSLFQLFPKVWGGNLGMHENHRENVKFDELHTENPGN